MILFAVGLFIYQTLDACDGKQARRTQSSSPLGELFDHGCDSLSTVFVALSACIAVQLGQYPNLMFYQCIAASALFYSAHWQTYVSAKLRFGRFDVTEAQFCIIIMHLVSAFCGPHIWSIIVRKSIPFSVAINYSLFFIHFFLFPAQGALCQHWIAIVGLVRHICGFFESILLLF